MFTRSQPYAMSVAGALDSLEQTGAYGTPRQCRFAAFSPREKVPGGRMRGKRARKTNVCPLT